MKNTILFTTLVAGLALTGCNKSTRTSTADTTVPPATDTAASRTPAATTDTVGARVDRAGERVADATRDAAASLRQTGRDISARMTEWKLNASDIEADVMAKRDIVRTRSDALTPTGKVDKGAIEKSLKAQLNSDAMLPGLKFDVNANEKGEVNLEGKARTTDQIAHAMAVALSHDGVAKVTSKIKLDPDAGPNLR